MGGAEVHKAHRRQLLLQQVYGKYSIPIGGRMGLAGDANVISSLIANGIKPADARITSSAIKEGVELLSRDKTLINRIPGIGRHF